MLSIQWPGEYQFFSVCVMQPGLSSLQGGITPEDARKNENQVFEKTRLWSHAEPDLRARFGTAALWKALGQKLFQVIAKQFGNPSTLSFSLLISLLAFPKSRASAIETSRLMNESRTEAISELLSGMTKTLNDKERLEIGKSIKFAEVREALKKAPNGKSPGPDGIPNEFWKEEIRWQEKTKENKKPKQMNLQNDKEQTRPCITALMTKVQWCTTQRAVTWGSPR